MANIVKRVGKSGKTSYLIRVSNGYDAAGRQIKRSMTWVPADGMTEKKVAKELQRQALKFEEQVNAGTSQDGSIRFEAFAEKWLGEYAEKQLKIKTVDGYKKQLTRINQAIGHIKLRDLKTGHLNSFYANLQESGMRGNSVKATAKKRLNEIVTERKSSRSALSKLSGVSSATVCAACNGKTVSMESAEKIAQAFDMKPGDVFSVERDMEKLSSSTVRSYHRVISSILAKAVKWGYIPYNPALNTELPKMPMHEAAHLDEGDARRLLDKLQGEPIKYRTMITFDLLSGLRRGELLGLRWSDIDFDNETITVRQTSSYVPSVGVYVDTPKNDTSNRPLKLSRSAFLLLRQYQEWQEGQKDACGDLWQDKEGRIFTTEEGVPVHPDTITKWFTAFVKREGLPKVTVHSLRHTYASLMIAEGTPLVVVSKRLGYAQVSTTANIYSHVIASADEKAAQITEKFADAILPPAPQKLKQA